MSKFVILCMIFFNLTYSQSNWISKKYNYKVEIPKGFQIIKATGKNVDFKVGDKFGNSVVIVVREFPSEFKKSSLSEVLGSAEKNANSWTEGANEFFDTPKLLKYGVTKIDNYEAYWMDYTTDNGSYYYKHYSVKKGNLFLAITFFSTIKNWNFNSALYFRFKEQMKL